MLLLSVFVQVSYIYKQTPSAARNGNLGIYLIYAFTGLRPNITENKIYRTFVGGVIHVLFQWEMSLPLKR